MTLTDALWSRRSAYSFACRPLELGSLSSLLRLALGVGRRVDAYGDPQYPLSLAPSAGGLRSVRPYVIVQRAEGLELGVYRYDAPAHELERLSQACEERRLREVFVQPEFAERAPVVIALVADLETVLRKYTLRHYRTVHVDTGLAVQNLYPVSTALRLAGCAVAGFHDSALGRVLGLSPGQIPTLLYVVGHRPGT